ncbi:hypothetical protein ACOMHN_043658 [Nucella lapillus]
MATCNDVLATSATQLTAKVIDKKGNDLSADHFTLGDVWALDQSLDFTHLDDIDTIKAQKGLPGNSFKSETLADTPMPMEGLMELCDSPTEGSFGEDWMEQVDFVFPDGSSILSLPLLDEDLGLNIAISTPFTTTATPNPAGDCKEEVGSPGHVFADEFLHSLHEELAVKLDTPPITLPSPQDQVAPEIILDAEVHDSSTLQMLNSSNIEFLQSPLSPDDVEVLLSSASSLSTSPAPVTSPSPTPSPTQSPSSPTTVDTSVLMDNGSLSLNSSDLYKVVENTEKTRPTPYSRPQKATKSKSKGRKQTASIGPDPTELELEFMSKKDRKKLQNKNAAIRYRQKKKVESDHQRSEVEELESINDDLRTKCNNLEREVKCMRDLINDIRKARDQPPMSFSKHILVPDSAEGRAAFEKREKRRTIRRLQEAIDSEDVGAVQEILQRDAEFDVDFRYRGQTALQQSVRLGAEPICGLLLGRGASVEEADGERNSLLNVACWHGYPRIARLLIDHAASLDSENEAGSTPLHACARKGHLDIVRLLVGAGCQLNAVDRLGCTAMMAAAKAGHSCVVGELAGAGADVNWMDQKHRTPLLVAAELGHLDIVRTLIRAGANVDAQDRNGHTALMMACVSNHVSVVQLLLDSRANPNLAAIRGTTPLLEAVSHQYMEVAESLLAAGCDVNLADRLHQAPMHEAIRQVSQYFDPAASEEAVGLVRRLMKCGANLDLGDNQGWTPLYQTAYGGHLELSKLLVESGADLTVLTSTGESIMHAAVSGNNLDIVHFLIGAGCSVNVASKSGQTPLMVGIISKSRIQILSEVVEVGGDINKAEYSSLHTPLHEAIHQHYNQAATLLIDAGCDLTAQNKEHQSALCLACHKGNEVIVTHLLAVLPRPLTFTTLSAIPAHAAAKEGHAHTLQLLAEGGSNINQLNLDGLTPLQVAVNEDNFAAARRLLQLGCDLDAHTKVTTLQKCCITYTDPHPHLALEPLFLALTHRNFDLIRLLFQCYAVVPFRVTRMLRAILRTSQELTVHYNADMKRDLAAIFHTHTGEPRSLQDTCRCAIRSSLGFPLTLKVKRLPLADKLQDYISMREAFDSWDKIDRQHEELSGRHGIFGWRDSAQ